MRTIKTLTLLSGLLSGLFVSALSSAEQLQLNIEIPRLNVAEYHRPYVAAWIQTPNGQVAANLAVWYDAELKDREGEKWLKDMRQWWRRSGRSQQQPIDGATGATKPPGQHSLNFVVGEAPLPQLKPGQYTLMVEAAREVGGRELIQIPFEWPQKRQAVLTEQGADELGKVELTLKP